MRMKDRTRLNIDPRHQQDLTTTSYNNPNHNNPQYSHNSYSTNPSPSPTQQITHHLKLLLQQRHPIKKLMLSCILSSLYIDQYNYQEAHKILTEMESTIIKLKEVAQQKTIKGGQKQKGFLFNKGQYQQELMEMAIIQIKMYANLVVISLINLQAQSVNEYLEKALEVITNFKDDQVPIQPHSSSPLQQQQQQNTNPNTPHLPPCNNPQKAIMLFQLLLKSFTGFESFQHIQAETLIAECQVGSNHKGKGKGKGNGRYEGQYEEYQDGEDLMLSDDKLRQYFYYSNMSFLKLLSTSDYQAAYKLQSASYELIDADISTHPSTLQQTILKTISLKKLLYLSQSLQLPSQIIKKYKQKLNSTQALQSKYLQGLQENTIFRNYSEKIGLGFGLVMRLKQFERDVVMPVVVEINTLTVQRKNTHNNKRPATNSVEQMQQNNTSRLSLWQCKAFKNKFIQVLGSKALVNNEQAKENIMMVVQCIDRAIERQRRKTYGGYLNSGNGDGIGWSLTSQTPVEQMLLLQSIGCTRDRLASHHQQQQTFHHQPNSFSLYHTSVTQYSTRLSQLCQTLQRTIFTPIMTQFLQQLQQFQEQPQIKVEIQRQIDNDKESDEEQSQPSIYLENVEFEVVGQQEEEKDEREKREGSYQYQRQQEERIGGKSVDKKIKKEQSMSKSKQRQRQKYQYQQVITHTNNAQQSSAQQVPKFTIASQQHLPSPSIMTNNHKHPNQNSNTLNVQQPYYQPQPLHPNPTHPTRKSPKKTIFLNQKNQVYMNYAQLGSRVKLNQHKPEAQSKFSPQSFKHHQQESKQPKYHHEESIRKQEGEIQIPHEDSVVKYNGRKYPFETQKEKNLYWNSSSPGDRNDIDTKAPLSHEQYTYQQSMTNNNKPNRNQHELKNTFSKVVQTKEEQQNDTTTQNRSLSKSRRKPSSLSPRVPKDSTINSRLNQHIRKHELTYSPESKASGIKKQKQQEEIQQKQQMQQKQQKQQKNSRGFMAGSGLKGKERQNEKDRSVSDYSASNMNLSPSSRSLTKIRPKVQKASGYPISSNNPKSPMNNKSLTINPTSNNPHLPLQNKTIKFKQYMQNLQKSGIININSEQQPKLKHTASRPKIQSKSGHRRIVTEANDDVVMSKVRTNTVGQGNNNSSILEGFFAQPKRRQEKRDVEEPSEAGSSPGRVQAKKVNTSQLIIPKSKRTGSQLFSKPQQQQSLFTATSNPYKQPFSPTKKPPTSPQDSRIKPQKQTSSSIPPESITSLLSPETLRDYIMKMMKNHKVKLSHAIRLCENGQYVDKKHYSSDGGDQRFLQLSSDHKSIEWAVSENKLLEGHKTKYQIKNIKGLVFGRVTQTMRKQSNRHLQPYKCISLIFQKRTFDMYCPDEKDVLFWLPGISCFVSQQRVALAHPNYTKNVERFVRKRQGSTTKKDDLHSSAVYYSIGRALWKRTLLKMQQRYLNTKKKATSYKNSNAGAIIEFNKAILREKDTNRSMLPPTGKESKLSRDNKSVGKGESKMRK